MPKCAACNEVVEMVYSEGSNQPAGGLHLENHYGYGMYRDHGQDEFPSKDILVCKQCIHTLPRWLLVTIDHPTLVEGYSDDD